METDQGKLLKDITSFLDKSKIPYMITGAWSVIFYGRPRASHDIDFVVEAHHEDIKRIKKAFATLPHDYLVQKDAIEEGILHQNFFNVLHLPTALKLDFFLLDDDEFNTIRFSRKRKEKILGRYMYVTSAEDTILKKLLWYNDSKIEKHLIDAAFVYQIQKKILDMKYILEWAKKHKTTKLFKDLAQINLKDYF